MEDSVNQEGANIHKSDYSRVILQSNASVKKPKNCPFGNRFVQESTQ